MRQIKILIPNTYARLITAAISLRWIVLLILFVVFVSATSSFAQTITFWHPWAQGARTVENLAAEYTRQTGVRINVRSFSPASYNPWTGGTQPDIVGLSYPSRQGVVSNARLGRIYDVEATLSRGWYSELWPGPLEAFTLRGDDSPTGRTGIYGVPLTVFVRAFVYNRNLFRRAGVSPPDTWSDFLLISPKLRSVGVVPMTGGLDGIYPSFPVIYEWSYLGSFYLLETYFGRYPYTGERWRRQFSIYQEMRQYGLTTYTAAQYNRTQAERVFLRGEAAVILDGPWFETARVTQNPRFTNWGVFGPPADRRASFLPRLPGGVAEGVVINSRSRNKTAALRFLRWLSEPAQQVRLANAMNSLPASRAAASSIRLNNHLRAFTPYIGYAAIELRYNENPTTLSTLYSGARGVVRGTVTTSAALAATQRTVR